MPLRLSVLVNIAVVMTLGVAFSVGANRTSSDQIERPIVMRQENRASLRDQDAMSLVRSPSLFFLHLLKHKLQIQKLEKITTTTTPTAATPTPTNSSRICICVPFYLCNANQTIITDGTGVIDVRWVESIIKTCWLISILSLILGSALGSLVEPSCELTHTEEVSFLGRFTICIIKPPGPTAAQP